MQTLLKDQITRIRLYIYLFSDKTALGNWKKYYENF